MGFPVHKNPPAIFRGTPMTSEQEPPPSCGFSWSIPREWEWIPQWNDLFSHTNHTVVASINSHMVFPWNGSHVFFSNNFCRLVIRKHFFVSYVQINHWCIYHTSHMNPFPSVSYPVLCFCFCIWGVWGNPMNQSLLTHWYERYEYYLCWLVAISHKSDDWWIHLMRWRSSMISRWYSQKHVRAYFLHIPWLMAKSCKIFRNNPM